MRLLVDASAALGIIARRGLAKARHIYASHLWIQEMFAPKRKTIDKTNGTINVADMMAKALSGPQVEKYTEMMGAPFQDGRAEIVAKSAQCSAFSCNDELESSGGTTPGGEGGQPNEAVMRPRDGQEEG